MPAGQKELPGPELRWKGVLPGSAGWAALPNSSDVAPRGL